MFETIIRPWRWIPPRVEKCQLLLPMLGNLNPAILRSPVSIINNGVVKSGNNYKFTGQSNLVLPINLNIVDQFSQGMWIKLLGPPPYQGHHLQFGDEAAELSIDPTYAIRVGVRVANVRHAFSNSPGSVSSSGWVHVAFTYKRNGGLKSYVNGVLKGNNTVPNGVLQMPTHRRIGVWNEGTGYGSNALYRSAFIYNVELTPLELKAIMNNT